jgi:hypothetical protein
LIARGSLSSTKINTMGHQKMTFSESIRNDIIPNNIFGKKFNMTTFLFLSRELLSLIRHCLFTLWEYIGEEFCVSSAF